MVNIAGMVTIHSARLLKGRVQVDGQDDSMTPEQFAEIEWLLQIIAFSSLMTAGVMVIWSFMWAAQNDKQSQER